MSTSVSEEEFKRITSLPAMADLLPYIFKNGSRIDTMTISCSQCNGNVPLENAHGVFTEYGTTTALSVYLLCMNCRIISPFEARLSNAYNFRLVEEQQNCNVEMVVLCK